MTDAALDALSKEFFDWYVRWNPTYATYVGVHAYDALLPKGTYAAQQEETAVLKETLARLKGIDRKGLSPGKRIDYGVLRNTLRLWIYQNEEVRIWESMPRGAEDLADALFPLFMRNFAPLPERMESLMGRLERAPGFLREARDRVRAPVRIWCEIGLESAGQVPRFVDVIRSAGKEVLPPADGARLEEAVAKADEALSAYAAWIREGLLPKAQDRFGIGAAKFRRLVALRELGLTVDEIYAIGKRYLRESKRELVRLAREIKAGATVQEAKEIVKGDHPADFQEALAYTARAMEDSKRFIREKGLATIPANEVLHVIETPPYLRHIIPFAAYVPPAKFDPKLEGFYMVTPYEDQPEMLREHSYAGTRNTAVHEGYPGHHLQQTCANLHPSYARLLAGAVETIEGWAHYCETMMKEQGFSADPSTRFVQILDQVWRACRILIDVDLHRGRMSFDEAVDLLVREVGMERPAAVAEVKRYTYNPAYQLSYLLGKHLILRMRRDVKRGLGKRFTEKFFHDTFLYAGSIPLTYMRGIFEYKVRELRKLAEKGL